MADDKADTKEALTQFTDCEGRLYLPRVTARVVYEFEKLAGFGVFEAVYDLLARHAEQKAKDGRGASEDELRQDVFSMAKKMMGTFSNIVFLLYEGCRPSKDRPAQVLVPKEKDGATVHEKENVSFEEFCNAITKAEVGAAVTVAIYSLFDFFPQMEGAGEGDGEPGPFERLLGGMFSNTPPSQE